MFNNVGLSIALGNGKEDVKKVADIVADDISNHGLAKELEKLFDFIC